MELFETPLALATTKVICSTKISASNTTCYTVLVELIVTNILKNLFVKNLKCTILENFVP